MRTREEAKQAIAEMLEIEVDVTKQFNYRRNGPTKKVQHDERQAIRRLFMYMTDSLPTEQEVEEMIP